jgi:hypothetical protein
MSVYFTPPNVTAALAPDSESEFETATVTVHCRLQIRLATTIPQDQLQVQLIVQPNLVIEGSLSEFQEAQEARAAAVLETLNPLQATKSPITPTAHHLATIADSALDGIDDSDSPVRAPSKLSVPPHVPNKIKKRRLHFDNMKMEALAALEDDDETEVVASHQSSPKAQKIKDEEEEFDFAPLPPLFSPAISSDNADFRFSSC